MICPKCKFKMTSVIDSRKKSSGYLTRRRRKCNKCGYRFTTKEVITNPEM